MMNIINHQLLVYIALTICILAYCAYMLATTLKSHTRMTIESSITKMPDVNQDMLDPRKMWDICNIRNVLSYIVQVPERTMLLTSNNKILFQRMFGHYSSSYRGEYLNFIWYLYFKNEIFGISTSNRGTSYSIHSDCIPNSSKTEVCIEFLQELEKLMTKTKEQLP